MSNTPITDANVCITTKEGCETIAPDICRKFERENAVMREAIKEVAHAMENLIIAKRGGMQPANALIDAITYAKAALTKLQPYLKP